jgi:hypothetical protein
MATTPTIDVCLTRFVTFSTVRKNGDANERNIANDMRIASNVPSVTNNLLSLPNVIILLNSPFFIIRTPMDFPSYIALKIL